MKELLPTQNSLVNPEVFPLSDRALNVRQDLLQVYRAMVTAREIDLLEEQYTARGEAFFHVSSAGHEAVAALNPHLMTSDYLHCHYRDKALMLARGISPAMFFYSLFCKDASHSRGRQMSAHMCQRSSNILSLVGPVGNNALQAVGVAAEIVNQSESPIVVCALGDGTTQQGEVLEAIAEAVRWQLPVLFLVEDNRFAISTLTDKKTFYNLPHQSADSFYGMEIQHLDGRDPIACYNRFGQIVTTIRETRQPALVLMSVERLSNHTNADDQTLYRDTLEIQHVCQTADPIQRLRRDLSAITEIVDSHLDQMEQSIRADVSQAAKQAQYSIDPKPIFEAKKPLSAQVLAANREYAGQPSSQSLTMLTGVREVLRLHLTNHPQVTLYGEDIEDPKGDVFGLTRSLSNQFPGRVVNSPLSESTIVGTAIGRALAGGRPIAFLQFADFLPLAFNQIISELGSMYWRTDGAWDCPVILIATCGGYRPGLGPFHAQSLEAIAVHTPGLDVAMPARAGDAVGMLNAAFASGRPTLFLYPKSCLNLNGAADVTSPDVEQQWVPIGKARIIRAGTDITLVGYGNTVQRCMLAAETLAEQGIEAEVIDLRWLSPWDQETVLDSVRKTSRLVVVHEDNQSCGMGSEILATIAEQVKSPVQLRRVTRADTFVPCNFANQLEVLPSYKRVLEVAAELLGLEVTWQQVASSQEKDIFTVEAVGTGPSDETLFVMDVMVDVGSHVQVGQTLASLEATKAVFDFDSPVSGVIAEILVNIDQDVQVGAPLFRIKLDPDNQPAPKPITKEASGQPSFQTMGHTNSASPSPITQPAQPIAGITEKAIPFNINRPQIPVGVVGVTHALPSHIASNQEVVQLMSDRDAASVLHLTGIENRHWITQNETVLTLAVASVNKLLQQLEIDIHEIDAIFCATGTPLEMTPSLACQILYEIAGTGHECLAYDLNAACSGYLYGLQTAYHYLQSHSHGKVLVVTAETLSPLLDPEDFNTGILFSDAATATLMVGAEHVSSTTMTLSQPLVSACGEPKDSLSVPLMSSVSESQHLAQSLSHPRVTMNGRRVFTSGVRRMTTMLKRICHQEQMALADLDLIVPHQANQRIIDAISKKIGDPEKVYSNIRHHGNTSSNSIPLCLAEDWEKMRSHSKIALTAFGGGFTYGAAILTNQAPT